MAKFREDSVRTKCGINDRFSRDFFTRGHQCGGQMRTDMENRINEREINYLIVFISSSILRVVTRSRFTFVLVL